MSQDSRIYACRGCEAKNRIFPRKVAARPNNVNCGSCGKPLFLPPDAPLTAIDGSAYQHPLDKSALEMLRKVPGTNTILRFLIRELSERRLRMYFQQAYVKVTPVHLTPLYDHIEHSAHILDLEMVPQLFVMNDPRPNAFAIGVDDPFVVVTTALLDTLDEAQIRGVIAHELGHIQAGHQLYRTALYLIVNLAQFLVGNLIPMRDMALKAIYYALLYWNRCSELTGDRAQMLIQRDYESYVACEMKFAGGCNYTNGMLNMDAFLEQAEEAVKMKEEHILNRVYSSMQAAETTHPYPVWRVGHMSEWIYDGNFLDIIHGTYPARKTADDLEPQESEEDAPSSVKELIGQWRKTLSGK
ncbi:MAG: M48 family metallopeptidase [Acidobacteriota bacterium]|nr:M48 family metallopeptidase [Acidobacteriota bacterium]